MTFDGFLYKTEHIETLSTLNGRMTFKVRSLDFVPIYTDILSTRQKKTAKPADIIGKRKKIEIQFKKSNFSLPKFFLFPSETSTKELRSKKIRFHVTLSVFELLTTRVVIFAFQAKLSLYGSTLGRGKKKKKKTLGIP